MGTIVYTAMCAPRGGIMCDLTITRTGPETFLVVTGGAVGRHDIAWMTRHLPWDGSVAARGQDLRAVPIGVWGPRARDLVAGLADADVSNAAFPYMTARELHLGPVPVRMLRISYVGELGWEIYAPTEFGLALWDLLWEAGAPLGAVACGGAAYDSLRLEKGYRLWGADIDEEHDPYEAGLGWAVKLDKGPFIGRETLARVKEAGRSGGCAASCSTTRRSCSSARSRSSTATRPSATSRAPRSARASARASPTATCRSTAPRSGPC